MKPIQIVYQIKNRLVSTKPLITYNSHFDSINKLYFFDTEEAYNVLTINKIGYEFHFLNLSKNFGKVIDWNFQEYGKLWNYNLQYLDFLKQNNIPVETKKELINSIYINLNNGRLNLEPYPSSLRIMNIIRFISTNTLDDSTQKKFNAFLKSESNYLNRNIEFHILANHLLENLFALLMSSYYFKDENDKKKFEKLITIQLNEQILNDGIHFELSPMYHKIILFRTLELYNYLPKENDFAKYIYKKACLMLTGLNNFSFKNNETPHFNDSTNGITYSNNYFYSKASQLGVLPIKKIKLKDSGYRKFNVDNIEFLIDINGINPSYQPGHAHADTFSFCLNFKNNPIIVDPGISTYKICERRNWERSTNAHNTIEIHGENSSEVWSGFRVGRRAKVNLEKDCENEVIACHDGYKKFGLKISRSIECKIDSIELNDYIKGDVTNMEVKSYIHFHPNVKVIDIGNSNIVINNELSIRLEGDIELIIENYKYCEGYNLYSDAKKLVIKIKGKQLKTTIQQIS